MKNLHIETTLREWAKKMVNRFEWLTIKFEYNENRERYLVSYFPSEIIDENDEFCEEAVHFEDEMNLQYLEDAPLFCDGERLFRLSENAEQIVKPIQILFIPTLNERPYYFIGAEFETNLNDFSNEYALAA